MKNDDYKNDDLNESEDKYLEKQDENINDNIEEKDIIDVDEVYEYDE